MPLVKSEFASSLEQGPVLLDALWKVSNILMMLYNVYNNSILPSGIYICLAYACRFCKLSRRKGGGGGGKLRPQERDSRQREEGRTTTDPTGPRARPGKWSKAVTKRASDWIHGGCMFMSDREASDRASLSVVGTRCAQRT